jgi:hypothetical protein
VTKSSLIRFFKDFFNILTFLWIVEHMFIVADGNTHRLVYHTYRVSAPIT